MVFLLTHKNKENGIESGTLLGAGIQIMPVLHGARDIEKIFAQDTEFTQRE